MLVSTERPNLNPAYAIFPLAHNWADEHNAAYDFKTDIIESDDGLEQRRAVRNEARRELEFSTLSHAVNRAKLQWYLRNRQYRTTIYPDITYKARMRTPPEPGSTVGALVNDRPLWLTVGADVVLMNGHVMETRKVQSLPNMTTIVFEESSDVEWGPDTFLAPALFGRVDEELDSDLFTNDVQRLRFVFTPSPGTFRHIEYFPGEYIDWREIFMLKPDWSSGVEVTYDAPREDVDYGQGVVAYFERLRYHRRIIRADYIAANWERAQRVIDFFHRQQGRLKEILLPTWEDDIKYDEIVGGTSQIIIRGQEFGLEFQDSTVFRRVMFRMRDGTFIHRGITDVLALPETDASVITLSEPLPAIPFNEQTVVGISWVLAARFATDKLEMEWQTNSVAQFRLTFQTLENTEV